MYIYKALDREDANQYFCHPIPPPESGLGVKADLLIYERRNGLANALAALPN